MFGVVVHDMHIDRAARVMITSPTALASTAPSGSGSGGSASPTEPATPANNNGARVLGSMISKTEHTHVERTSVSSNGYSSSMPKVRPPRGDDHRYVQNRREYEGGGDEHTYIWPSQ